jgi:sortase A
MAVGFEPDTDGPEHERPAEGEAAVDAAQSLAAFYDRRAPAALAYCARVCEPESIADAVEEAFGHVFAAASGGPALDDGELDRLLRRAVRAAATERAATTHDLHAFDEAERAYDALSGDDAPVLGRSLLGEMIEAEGGEGPAPEKRRRPRIAPGWRRRVAIVLGVVGVLLLAEAVVTLAWKEPFTGYLAAQAQDDLDRQLDNQNVDLDAAEQRSLATIRNTEARARRRMALLAGRYDAGVAEGEALGRIQIPRIGIDFVFVQGIEGASLRKGPGHYSGVTKLPGQGGTVGVAGHRTTYEAPFREIDALEAGDHITLRMPYGLFTYEVTGHRIVPADYSEAFSTAGTGERLVLSACHPLYSSEERILVDAKLLSAQPLGSAVETSVPAVPAPSAAEVARRRTAARLEALGDRFLVPGMTGPDVRELQRLLGMPVTGTFDPNTGAAVLAFQRDHGLPQVGQVGTETKRALARRTHPPSRPPTPAEVPEQTVPGPTGTQGTYAPPVP